MDTTKKIVCKQENLLCVGLFRNTKRKIQVYYNSKKNRRDSQYMYITAGIPYPIPIQCIWAYNTLLTFS